MVPQICEFLGLEKKIANFWWRECESENLWKVHSQCSQQSLPMARQQLHRIPYSQRKYFACPPLDWACSRSIKIYKIRMANGISSRKHWCDWIIHETQSCFWLIVVRFSWIKSCKFGATNSYKRLQFEQLWWFYNVYSQLDKLTHWFSHWLKKTMNKKQYGHFFKKRRD